MAGPGTYRIQWKGTVPAGGGAEVNFPVGSIPEGKKLTICACSYWGGDAGEKYGINLVPAGQPTSAPVDAESGGANLIYPMGGGTQTLTKPINIMSYPSPVSVIVVPGPYNITISTTAASAAAFSVQIIGYLEDL